MKVNNITITSQTILATRMHFIDIHNRCIDGARSGEWRVNNLERYVANEIARINRLLSGEADRTLTFLQAALWVQTGECVGILG